MDYECAICNKKYKSYQSIWNHNNRIHSNLDICIVTNIIHYNK